MTTLSLRPLSLMVMGHGRHGKGTFCTLAKQHFNLSSMGSSLYACNTFLFEMLREKFGYATVAECYADRHRNDAMRELWYKEIFAFNTPDRTRLGRGIYAEAPIYDGVRDDLEFLALKQAGLIDLSIWIDASERMPLEPETSIKVNASHADIILTNNSTVAEFEAKVIALLRALYTR